MIIGVGGLVFDEAGNKQSLGAGKDTVCDRLVAKHRFQKVGFADVMKRFVREVFDFSDEQLWGSSEHREGPDKRYVQRTRALSAVAEIQALEDGRSIACLGAAAEGRAATEEEQDEEAKRQVEEQKKVYLTPRHALQTLGTEWGRNTCWSDVWVAYAMRVAKKIEEGHAAYDPQLGLRYHAEVAGVMETKKNVCFSDVRFKNEFDCIRAMGGKVIRVRRPAPSALTPAVHQSELDLLDIPDDEFDYVIHGLPVGVEDLQLKVDEMMQKLVPVDPVERLADAIEVLLEREGIDPQNITVVSHSMSFGENSAIVQEDVPLVGALLDSRLVPEDNPLHALLVAREKDVELGRIRPYDPEKEDVPPFLRDADAGVSKMVYNPRAVRKITLYADEESAQHVNAIVHASVCKTAEYPVTDAPKPADDQCCSRDYDHDGNCDVHPPKK